MIVINQGRVNYCYRKSESEPVVYETICSNRVKTFIINYDLCINKRVDRIKASLWEVLTYTIVIHNISENIVENIIIRDNIPDNTEFIEGSLKVNGVIQQLSTPKELYIGNLKANEKSVVSFKVVIIKCNKNKSNVAINFGEISYDYICNIEEEPIRINVTSNKVKTLVKCNIFSQISQVSKVCIKVDKYEKIKINKIDMKIQPIKYKVISTKIGYKLLIIFKISYLISYFKYNLCGRYKKNMLNSYDYFSIIMEVPDGIKYINKDCISIEIIEENFKYILLERSHQLNIYNTILVYLN